ncbi:MAG: hypothetical protein AB1394_07520 [Bacteroidota bacterium]
MNQHRTEIEQLKEEIRATLQHDTLVYRRAVIREIESLWRSYNLSTTQPSLERFADYIFNYLKIPRAHKESILRELKETDIKIATVWEDYFSKETDYSFKPSDYSKLVASYSIDFPQIDKDIKGSVLKTVRQSVRSNYSFEIIRSNLQRTGMDTAQIYTLGNTACSMFDNAVMFEKALQAGINKFKYDGPGLVERSHDLCIKSYGKIFTYEEILQLDNGQGIPVLTSCGGYNCRHYWTAVINKILGRKRSG